MEGKKLSLHFYIYIFGEAALAIAGLMLFQRGYFIAPKTPGLNVLIFVLIVQIIWHIIIVLEGYRKGTHELYQNLYPFSVPSMFMIFIVWYNTF